MQISKREFLKCLGLGGVGLAAGAAVADEYVADMSLLPKGSCGDPKLPGFGRHIFPLEHTMTDGASCALVNGEVLEPARKIPIFHKADVVVVGGGPAGFAAAVASARTGAKTVLLERYGSLGGLFTNGMVLIMLATSECVDGKYRLVTKGICEEFMRRAVALGPHVASAKPRPQDGDHWQPTVDPEGAKYLMDRMTEEAGVETFFHCWGVDTIQDEDKVLGVVFESKQGRQAILAKTVVDCTGDADVLFQAGGDYRQITHAIGHEVRLANMDRITAKTLPQGPDGRPLKGKWLLKGNEANPSTWWGNNGPGPTGNGLSVRDLTKAEKGFRKEWWEFVQKMRGTPGWEQVFIANTCSQIGPRASRLVDAETIVDRKAQYGQGRPTDTVGLFGTEGAHFKPFYVPYRQLVPKRIDNLLCAGRCLGAGDTIDIFRLICPCFVTGEAAGTAAALAVQTGVRPRDLDVGRLQRTLEANKVCLA